MSNKIYDIIKMITVVILPAISAFLVTLTSLWGWSIPIEAIVGTIAAVETLLGSILTISNYKYKKANANIPTEE